MRIRGRVYEADVNKHERLLTSASSHSGLAISSARDELAFTFTTGFVSLTTTASPSGILYLKNTHADKDFRIHVIRTDGAVAQQWEALKNATIGTLISGGAILTPVNMNFASGQSFLGEAKKGTDAQTITDGVLVGQWISGVGSSIHKLGGALILGTNNTLALRVTPSVAGDVCAIIFGHFSDRK